MAASANPSGNHDEPSHGNPSNGSSVVAPENSGPATALRHNPGVSTDWSADEQSILEEGLTQYVSESNIIRYAKIAMQLQNKTVRDVALRCRWMTKKESSKRRKEDHNLTRKSKEKKEKVTDPSAKSSHLPGLPGFSSYLPMNTMDNDDGISYQAIGGTTGQLLEQNAQALSQITANLESHQIQENIGLFCQTRDNIFRILNNLNDMPDIMKQMPPLPVKVNEDLVNSILPRTTHPMQ